MNHTKAPRGISLAEMTIGMQATLTKTITEQDILLYAEVTGDDNPVHTDEAFAQTTLFKTRIAQGMLSAGLISAVLGTKLPGTGTIYLKQDLRFLAPVKIGDTVTATVTVREINPTRKRVTLETICTVGERVVIDGTAEVMPPNPQAS